ncbi:hypothetical protein [Saccharothrix australiensis]|uniref:Alpha amylase inhibitor n=1 Tax=Saccharothrix australiensis TaxID=2072 RepID=A0A495VXN2_9PSEU|nr:hypothetical protein [Saccharothrix australiensis]RKT53590.1 hypothetical protein C8E97_2160 [Saccharothrix australiensis]
MNYRKLVLALAATAGAALVGAAPAVAGPAEASSSTPPTAAASYNCYGFHKPNPHRWAGGCSVASGQIRTITYCSDGSNRVGGWIGARPNPWLVYGECGEHLVQNTGFIVETRG